MNQKTDEWVEKAEGDWGTMLRESRVKIKPNHEAVCFHPQQCAEKYLKARLWDLGISFAKIHDLEILLNDLLPSEPGCAHLRNAAIGLTSFAVEFRYPGMKAIRADARDAVKLCRQVRNAVRASLNLPQE